MRKTDFNYRTGAVIYGDSAREKEEQMIDEKRQHELKLTEDQVQTIQDMVDGGMDEREALLRVLTIAKPRDIDRPVRNLRRGDFPKMIYHPDGEHKVVKNEAEYRVAQKDGWADEPAQIHLDKFQEGSKLTAARPEAGEPAIPDPPKSKKAKK